MNLYRSSIDLHPAWHSVLNNLNSTIAFRDGLSGPGCWAYPGPLLLRACVCVVHVATSDAKWCRVRSTDMLQVGVTSHVINDVHNPYGYSHGGIRNPHYLNWIEGRTHFAGTTNTQFSSC
jgi:hypothetical protein